jgi:MFS family permease
MMANVDWDLYTPAEAAMVADITVSSRRGRLYGLVGVAHPIGSIVAPLVGGWILDNYGWNAVFYSIVFTAIVALIPTLLITETMSKREKHAKACTESSRHMFAKVDSDFLYPMLIFAGFNFFEGIRMGLSQITSIYLKERFNVTSFQQGLFFSVRTMVPFLVV